MYLLCDGSRYAVTQYGNPGTYVEGMYVSKDELAAVKKGKELEVPDEDAHAWVEVFDEKYGFVTVEVTPGKGEDDMTGSEILPMKTPIRTRLRTEHRQIPKIHHRKTLRMLQHRPLR